MTDKQTAVEWLEERINIGLTYEQDVLFEGLFQQAKEMEKQQIMDAHNDGHNYYAEEGIDAKQYYNKTFKNTEE